MDNKGLDIYLNSGLSIISAFAAWKGAALALDRQMIMRIRETDSPKSSRNINMILKILSRDFGKPANFTVDIAQKIPSGMGLKSSSALVAGIVKGYFLMNDMEKDTNEIVSISSKISREVRVSTTGAADDLYASLLGGLCVTDNRKNFLARRYNISSTNYVMITSPKKISSYEMKRVDLSHLKSIYHRMWQRVNTFNYEDMAVMNGFYLSTAIGKTMDMPDLSDLSFNWFGINGKGSSLFLRYDRQEIMARDVEEIGHRGYNCFVAKSTNTGASYKWLND
jgi:shikimate kinase